MLALDCSNTQLSTVKICTICFWSQEAWKENVQHPYMIRREWRNYSESSIEQTHNFTKLTFTVNFQQVSFGCSTDQPRNVFPGFPPSLLSSKHQHRASRSLAQDVPVTSYPTVEGQMHCKLLLLFMTFHDSNIIVPQHQPTKHAPCMLNTCYWPGWHSSQVYIKFACSAVKDRVWFGSCWSPVRHGLQRHGKTTPHIFCKPFEPNTLGLSHSLPVNYQWQWMMMFSRGLSLKSK